eukprot:gnl/MRDRNA2_/MRDRNA2_150661_c0_seq1.p1 gnl/MRDRNA2_/MRDRNA2_150661_c0~~gnl/MRDRNA2_/MRDRNA2_150661_c0_seq1.p1  ORF type:complete len:216 (+),score=7.67 gnl/MRDRNA2_/MRDRNA2_150661_c0_seq1:119-766(+)
MSHIFLSEEVVLEIPNFGEEMQSNGISEHEHSKMKSAHNLEQLDQLAVNHNTENTVNHVSHTFLIDGHPGCSLSAHTCKDDAFSLKLDDQIQASQNSISSDASAPCHNATFQVPMVRRSVQTLSHKRYKFYVGHLTNIVWANVDRSCFGYFYFQQVLVNASHFVSNATYSCAYSSQQMIHGIMTNLSFIMQQMLTQTITSIIIYVSLSRLPISQK